MTITNQTNKTIQAGNGTTATFNFAFPIFQASDLKVYKYLTSSTETTHTPLTITTDYTVVISSTTEGGSVTFVETPLATETIAIIRDLAYTQTTDIDLNGNFPEVDVENALDKNDMLAIQLKEQSDRALKISQFFTEDFSGEVQAPSENKALVWKKDLSDAFYIGVSTNDPDEQVANATAQAVIATTQAGLATAAATAAEGYRDEAQAAAASINGDPLWNATKTFSKGDIITVIVSDIPYKYYNLTGTNTATSPESDATNWALYSDKDRVKQDGSNATLSALAATAISNIQKLLTPNYGAAVSKATATTGWTADVNGVFKVVLAVNSGEIKYAYINGAAMFSINSANAGLIESSSVLQVFVGDVVTYSSTASSCTFYPYRTL